MTIPMRTMTQVAPYPGALRDLVDALVYKSGWRFSLVEVDRGQASVGLTLLIRASGPDSYHPERTINVMHYMPVPPAAYDARSWRRWLFEQILLVERHEAMEFFAIHHGSQQANSAGELVEGWDERPYAPSHGPGNDPYIVREVGTEEDRRMSYRGEMNPQ